jgi:hypothetical protein
MGSYAKSLFGNLKQLKGKNRRLKNRQCQEALQELGVMTQVCNPSTQEAKGGGF